MDDMTTERERPRLLHSVSDNIRAELARSGMTARQAQERLDLGEAAWRNRMAEPGSWKWGEILELARWLHIRPSELTRGAP